MSCMPPPAVGCVSVFIGRYQTYLIIRQHAATLVQIHVDKFHQDDVCAISLKVDKVIRRLAF